jgi:hypothetical protein
MMTRLQNNARPWRVLWLIPVAAFAVLSIVATGGGGGSGDDGIVDIDDDLPVVILPNYNFFLANLSTEELLTATVGNLFTVSVDIDGLFPGNLDLNTDASNNVTFVAYRIRQSARVDLTVAGVQPSALDGTFAVIVTEDISANIDVEPDAGIFEVRTPTETVVVSILATGIQLVLNGGEPVVYNTWEEFSDLIEDDTQDTWQRRAALAAGVLEFLTEQFFDVADVLDTLELVTLSNPVIDPCDLFPGTPPAGVLNQGDITVTWLGSGELSDGDDFDWSFNQCWSVDDEEVINGTITLQNYTETVDFSDNSLFEIGFGGLSGQPGGVIYDITLSETQEDNTVFTILPEDIVTLTGGFVLIIQVP